MLQSEENFTLLDDEEIFVNIGQYYGSSNGDDTTDESESSMEQ
jgi:hypothetical protein